MKDLKAKINFIGKDNKNHTFFTETNTLNNCQMYWMDNTMTMYASTKKRVNSIIKDLKENYKGIVI